MISLFKFPIYPLAFIKKRI